MITKFNQYIKESLEDVYPTKGFKILTTEDEEYVVFSRNMSGVFLIPTDMVSGIIESGDIAMLQIEYGKHHDYTLSKNTIDEAFEKFYNTRIDNSNKVPFMMYL